MGRELQSRLWLLPRSRGLFSRRTEINGFRLQVLRTQGLQASINATASISSNLDKAFPFNTNHGKPLISVLLLNKPQSRRSDPQYSQRAFDKQACLSKTHGPLYMECVRFRGVMQPPVAEGGCMTPRNLTLSNLEQSF